MSESVKIGGIGKNPAIDRINSLNMVDVKKQAVKRMEQLLLATDAAEGGRYTKTVPVDFSGADWKGTAGTERKKERTNGSRKGRNWMAGISLSEWEAAYQAPGGLGDTGGGGAGGEVSLQYEAAGNIRGLPGRQDLHDQQDGEAAAGETGIPGSAGDTAGGQPRLSGKRQGPGTDC